MCLSPVTFHMSVSRFHSKLHHLDNWFRLKEAKLSNISWKRRKETPETESSCCSGLWTRCWIKSDFKCRSFTFYEVLILFFSDFSETQTAVSQNVLRLSVGWLCLSSSGVKSLLSNKNLHSQFFLQSAGVPPTLGGDADTSCLLSHRHLTRLSDDDLTARISPTWEKSLWLNLFGSDVNWLLTMWKQNS